jgi:ATP-binding cassette subfamily F protein uup
MNLVTLENVSKQYSEKLLLDGVSLQVNSGDRIGLIGLNGSGKTTLLRMIAGLEKPDAGTVTIWGRVRVRYLPQNPVLNEQRTVLEQLFDSEAPQIQLLRRYEQAAHQLQRQPDSDQWQAEVATLSDEMERTGSWAAEAAAKTILTRLGITDFEARSGALSGGQQRRVALAQALIDPADLLILDEPTNHVDADTIDWLEQYLATGPRALLMVTHDRYFLDRVVNRILELDRRELVSYDGNYQRYLEKSAERQDQLQAAEAKQQNLLRRELYWLSRSPQARGTKQKARKQRVEELQTISRDQDTQVSIALAGRRLGKQVLAVQGVSKQFDDVPLFANVDFELGPGDRIGIVGPNGAGKSTFLNIIAGTLPADAGQVTWGETVHLGYFDQQSSRLDDSMRVIDFIKQEAPLIQTKNGEHLSAFKVLEWFLFPKEQQYAYISTLSGGERRRLYLLFILMQRPNVLLLDEPTNDLDIQTLTVLEEFLDHFNGSLIVVSHDRYLLDRATDYLVSFENGQVSRRFPTPFETFQRLRSEQRSSESTTSGTSAAQPERARPNRSRKLSYKEQQELTTLGDTIDALETRQAALQSGINQAATDYLKLQPLVDELQVVESELDRAMERWLELTELAEA